MEPEVETGLYKFKIKLYNIIKEKYFTLNERRKRFFVINNQGKVFGPTMNEVSF